MIFTVQLTEDAAADLKDIYTYISEHDSANNAEYVLDEIEKKFCQFERIAGAGSVPERTDGFGNS